MIGNLQVDVTDIKNILEEKVDKKDHGALAIRVSSLEKVK